MADTQTYRFERLAVDWYVRNHVFTDPKRASSFVDRWQYQSIGEFPDLSDEKEEAIRFVGSDYLLPTLDDRDEKEQTITLSTETRDRLLPKCGVNERQAKLLSQTILTICMYATSVNGGAKSENTNILSSLGRMLVKTREDEIVTSGIASTGSIALPLSVWPVLLERAWKKKYAVPDRGPDAIFHLLRNAEGLRNGIGRGTGR